MCVVSRLPSATSQNGYATNTPTNLKTPPAHQPITLRSLKPSSQDTKIKVPHTSKDPPNTETQQDLKSLLLDVRTLITTFQTHVTPTPAKHHSTQSEQYKIKDIGNSANDMDNMPDSEMDISFDMDDGCHGNFRPPLGSSSPKPDRDLSISTSHEPSARNNDSFVSSLLSFSTGASVDNPSDLHYSESSSKRDKTSQKMRRSLKNINDAHLSKTKTKTTIEKHATSSKAQELH